MIYLYSKFENPNFIYFTNPKTASRSLRAHLKNNSIELQTETPKKVTVNIEDYFKFVFVRNPWDRILSAFLDKAVRGASSKNQLKRYAPFKDSSFSEFVASIKNSDVNSEERHIQSQIKFIPDYVDFIGRYENLTADMSRVCEEIGIPFDGFPHANKTNRVGSYRDYYDDYSKDVIADKYYEEIERFNYKF
ncbi:sulfotransferase family protein [Deltaproteobacteria bacterium]|nr:sulfotransferase family protein [Deltaproteobacteria bacterium]